MSDALPVYDPTYPAIAQNDSWSCAPTSTRWMLWSLGRTPSESWIESTMIAEGVVSTELGCLDKSGHGLAEFVTRHYGFATGNDGYDATFDELAGLAGSRPYGISGGNWYHWSGLRGFDGERLILANPASGYMGVTQSMDRQQFAALGPWSYFWIEAVLAGEEVPVDEVDVSRWIGFVGSGILEQMEIAGVVPVQSSSSWLPLGSPAADVEECMASDGSIFRWVMEQSRCYRFFPGG